MTATNRSTLKILCMAATVVFVMAALDASAQRGGRGGFNQPDSNLPDSPTAVAMAAISEPVTGPGTMYESVQSLPRRGAWITMTMKPLNISFPERPRGNRIRPVSWSGSPRTTMSSAALS